MEDPTVDSCGKAPRRNCDEREEESSSLVQHTQATESKASDEWTDEKHSLYLKSMENTFVDQLYKSLDLFGQNLQKNYRLGGSKSSRHRQTSSTSVPSGQFKVLRGGCWSKIDFRRGEGEINQVDCGGLSENPWIQHYICSERQATRKCLVSTSKNPSPTTVNQYLADNSQLWHQESLGSIAAEVTDQNFNDEDVDEEKPGRTHEIKRMKTSSDTVSSNDQVVPFENIVQVDDATEDHLHLED